MNQTAIKQRMKETLTRGLLISAVVLTAVAGIGIWVSIEARHEPVYKGKRVTAWIDELQFTNPGQPNPALYALIQIGPDAVPYIARRLRWRESNKFYVALYRKVPASARRILPRPRSEGDRGDVAWALQEFGLLAQSAMPDLIHALNDRSSYVRREAANTIPWLGPARKSAVPALIRALNDPDAEFQNAARSALAVCGPDAEAAIPALTARVRGTNDVARLAVWALGMIGPAAGSAVPSLLETLELGHSRWPDQIIMSLGQIGPNAKQAIPTLRKVLTQPDHELHTKAADALGLIGAKDSESLQALEEALVDSQCRIVVARALWRLDPRLAKRVAPKLVDSPDQWNPAWPPQPGMPPYVWPSHPDATVSLSFEDWSLLSELGPAVKDAFPDFSPLLAHTNALLRVFAATAVWYAERDADKVRNVLAAEINHTNATVKKWAALGLWKVDPDSPLALPALVSLIDDKEGNVSSTACSSLAWFGERAKPAVPAVVRALRHEHWVTRRMATWTLMRIDLETAANVGMKRP